MLRKSYRGIFTFSVILPKIIHSTMPEAPKDQNYYLYKQYYQFEERSEWMEKIWAEALGENYPAGLDQYGYFTFHDLRRIAAFAETSPGEKLLDIGCGKGGPGLKLAEELQLQLTGIDIIPEAIDQANAFASQFNLAYPAHFQIGGFMDIPVAENSMDCVISIDSLWAAPDKIQALAAIKNILKPGGRFIYTSWDLLEQDPIELLSLSGLKFLHREETPNWKDYQQKVYAGILKYREELDTEMGAGADMLIYEAQASSQYLDVIVRRVYVWENPVV